MGSPAFYQFIESYFTCLYIIRLWLSFWAKLSSHLQCPFYCIKDMALRFAISVLDPFYYNVDMSIRELVWHTKCWYIPPISCTSSVLVWYTIVDMYWYCPIWQTLHGMLLYLLSLYTKNHSSGDFVSKNAMQNLFII